MQSMQHQLASSYSQHPSFQFDQPEWDLSSDLLAAFVDSYQLVRVYGARLTRAQFDASVRQCEAALGAIFASLKAQTGDAHEVAFLHELEQECTRLQRDELAHLHRGALHDFVDLANVQVQAHALQLAQDLCYFDTLPEPVVRELLDMGAQELARCRAHASAGRLTREDLSVNSGAAVRGIMRVLNREFGKLGVLACVSAYAGSRMTVTGLALELSVPQATWWANGFDALDRAPMTLYAHLDESILYPKSIVYLSAVDAQNGPTGVYRQALPALGLNPLQEIVGRVLGNVGNLAGSALRDYYRKPYHQSMRSAHFRAHFMRLPQAMRFNSHLGWDVCPGSALEQTLVQSETRMTGPAGTFVVFDGARLLHRGGMVQTGERIALQVVFSSASKASRVLRKMRRVFAS